MIKKLFLIIFLVVIPLLLVAENIQKMSNLLYSNELVDIGVVAGTKGTVPEQLIRGRNFERVVLDETGLLKNTTKIGNRIPDSLSNGVITEIKDVNYLYQSGQLKTFLGTGKPVNLIVSPNTTISQPLYNAIMGSQGSILIRTGANTYVPYIP